MSGLREAARRALEAWDTRAGIDAASKAFEALRAALADMEDAEWEVDYEVRVATGDDEMWVAVASTCREALYYAAQYVEEGAVRVYERRMKVIATMEARND